MKTWQFDFTQKTKTIDIKIVMQVHLTEVREHKNLQKCYEYEIMKIRGRNFPGRKFGLQQNYIANSRNKRLARSARVCLDSPKSHDSLLSYVASLSKPRYVYNVYIRVIYVCILSLERFELIGARRIPPEPVRLPRKNHQF